jgi:hypothetical protein
MKQELTEIEINGIKYIKKDAIIQKAEKLDGLEYVIIRTYSAGVHAGYLEFKKGKEVTLKKSRRIWYWDGACSLSQLSVDGTSLPANCRFSIEVEKIELTECIEVLYCTEKAKLNIQGVSIWKE